MSKYIKGTLLAAYKMIFRLIGSLQKNNKKVIVFESFLGKQYSDNPKSLYLYIKEHYPEYKLYWSFDRRKYPQFKDKVDNALSRFGLKWLFVMPRASHWISNSRLPEWLSKPKKTLYVQTWHGTPLKKLGIDIEEIKMPGTTTEKYRKNFINEAKKWDILISPNEYSTKIFKQAFQFNNTVIESGYPRNDILYLDNQERKVQNIKEGLNLPTNRKVLLYAPTWRDNDFYSIGRYKLNLQLDLQHMQQQLGDRYVILIRTHYLVAEQLDLSGVDGFAYNVSMYPDINELYLISDLLITDYSSVFFDYANLRRPMIFFTYDIEEYRDELRGFYFDFEKEAPGPLVRTTKDVIKEIVTFEEANNKLSHGFEEFYDKFCILEDGNASERVVQYILNK